MALKIRSLRLSDRAALEEIHKQYFHEFPMPDFIDKCIGCFVIEDEEQNIVSAGGLHLVTEAIFLTDKRASVRQRKEALEELQKAMVFLATHRGFDQIHAFVQQKSFAEHLKKYGFVNPKGESLVLTF